MLLPCMYPITEAFHKKKYETIAEWDFTNINKPSVRCSRSLEIQQLSKAHLRPLQNKKKAVVL